MKTVVEMVFGSHLYGLNTEKSDKDYKGIFIPDPKDIILGGTAPKVLDSSTNKSKSKNTVQDIDKQMYSLKKFLSMGFLGDTIVIDMIHAPDNMIVQSSTVWDFIRENRSKFYTSELTGVFGYVKKQAAKYGVKGSRVATCKEVLNIVNQYPDNYRLFEIEDQLPLNEFCFWIDDYNEHTGNQRFYSVLQRKFQSTQPLSQIKESLTKIDKEYGERARQAERNEGVDWKAVSHALRAGYQLKSIFSTGDLIYPLAETDYILSVKKGEVKFQYVQEELEQLMDTVESLSTKSGYPKQVDKQFWNDFLLEVYSTEILNYYGQL